MAKNTRLLAVDWGQARHGLALSDPLAITAHPLPYLAATTRKADLAALRALCQEKGVGRILLGLPKDQHGGEGKSAAAVREFGQALGASTRLPVVYLDERLTTKAAERLLIAADVSRADRKQKIDSMAATMLLQNYLDAQDALAIPPPPADVAGGQPRRRG